MRLHMKSQMKYYKNKKVGKIFFRKMLFGFILAFKLNRFQFMLLLNIIQDLLKLNFDILVSQSGYGLHLFYTVRVLDQYDELKILFKII